MLKSMRKKAGLDHLRLVVSGGAALPAFVAEYFDTIGLPLLQGYGMTETSPVLTVNRPGQYRYDTVGPPLPGAEVSIVDPRPDGIGEIAARGPMVMKGYWKMPEETAKVFRDGWLLTGDLGSIESDGHVKISGRSKNVIITGAGKNVYPEEVEAVLGTRDEILESVVYGLTKPGKIGEVVAAVIVPDADWYRERDRETWQDDDRLQDAIGAIVREACNNLAPFKRIAHYEIQRDPFEKTSTRKIKRHLVTKGRSEAYASASTLWTKDGRQS
jgi:long-chain acyl-CoA synthetase